MPLHRILFFAVATLSFAKQWNQERNIYDRPSDENEYNHPCQRPCQNSAPMTCEYLFIVEWYYTMSKACFDCPRNREDCYRADCVIGTGVGRPIVTVNRTIPGPLIDVCVGDQLMITVRNKMLGETTSIHWHGIPQFGTPYMDGVPFVTQCPIHSGTSFLYNFTAATAGTFFYHSHTGIQRGNGLFGSLIVRDPEDPYRRNYTHDLPSHVLNIRDWYNDIQEDMYLHYVHAGAHDYPSLILVNGIGFNNFTNITNEATIARCNVYKNRRYRFRVINSAFRDCPVEISVDNHKLEVISSDGHEIFPVFVDTLTTFSGERYDFILTTNKKRKNYWMRFRGLINCAHHQAFQLGVLHYHGSPLDQLPEGILPSYENSINGKHVLNPFNIGEETQGPVIASEMRSLTPIEPQLLRTPDYKFYLDMDLNNVSNPAYNVDPSYGFQQVTKNMRTTTPQMNNIAFEFPETPLITNPFQDVCNEASFAQSRNCTVDFCHCTHLIPIDLNKTVELVLIDNGWTTDAGHPFHLHGMSFRVLTLRKLGSWTTKRTVIDLDAKGLINRNFNYPPIKDTIIVPDGGYVVVRFIANNPGYWFFHCHIDYHTEMGMALIFKVGKESDISVPEDFPTCGSYPSAANSGLHFVDKLVI